MYISKKWPRPALRVVAGTALAAAILLTSAVPMAANGESTLSGLKNQYASLQQQQQQLQSQISSQNAKLQTVNQQMATLDKSIALTNQQIAVLNAQIADTDAQLKAKAADITSTEARVKKNTQLFKERMVALYENNPASPAAAYLEILFASSNDKGFNINQLLNNVELYKVITQHDTDLITSLQNDEQRLKDDQAVLQADKNSLETQQGTLAGQQESLNAQRTQQAQLAADLKAGIVTGRQQMSTVKQQAAQTDAQIDAEMKKEADLRAAQLAAQKAAAAAQSSGGNSGNSSQSADNGGAPAGGGSSVAGSVSANQLVAYAVSFANERHPYQLGSAGPYYYDCSGFTAKVFAWAGVYLDHSAASQAMVGAYVSKNNLHPGDLICFDTEHAGAITHVGIYIGGGQFVAANTSTGIAVASLSTSYWTNAIRYGRRIIS